MTPGRCCRALRAAVFAATCVLLAALGHILMSGSAVPWWAMAAGFLTVGATVWILTDRERSVPVITLAVVTAQAALHAGFTLAQAAVHPSLSHGVSLARHWAHHLLCGTSGSVALPTSEALDTVTRTGPDSHLYQPHGVTLMGLPGGEDHAHQAMTDSASMPVDHDMGGTSPLGMVAAHLLAALLCGLWLAYGEQAAFRILRAFAGWIAAPLRLQFRLPTPLHRPQIRIRRIQRACALRQLLLVHVITSRGPPHGIAVI